MANKMHKIQIAILEWHQSFSTARNTLDEMETMRMIQKGQAYHVGKDVVEQNQFVRIIFG